MQNPEAGHPASDRSSSSAQQDLPTADSLFGDSSPVAASIPFTAGIHRAQLTSTAPRPPAPAPGAQASVRPFRPQYQGPPQAVRQPMPQPPVRPRPPPQQQQQHQQQHPQYPRPPPQHQVHQRLPMQARPRPPMRPPPQQSSAQPRPSPRPSSPEASRAAGQSPFAMSPGPHAPGPATRSSPVMQKSPRSSLVEPSPPLFLAPASAGDSLPSADILFGGGSTSFDLFQPQHRPPTAPAHKLDHTNASSQPQSPPLSFSPSHAHHQTQSRPQSRPPSRLQSQALQPPLPLPLPLSQQPSQNLQPGADGDQAQEPSRPNRIIHHTQELVSEPDIPRQTVPIPAPARSVLPTFLDDSQPAPLSKNDREYNTDRTQDNSRQLDTHTQQGADSFARQSAAMIDDGAHQDSSALFAGSPDVDASHFFSSGPDTDTSMLFAGSSANGSTPFFGSYSVQDSSAMNGKLNTVEPVAASSTAAAVVSNQLHKDASAHPVVQAEPVKTNDCDSKQPEQPHADSSSLSTVSIPETRLGAAYDHIHSTDNLQVRSSIPAESLSDQSLKTTQEPFHGNAVSQNSMEESASKETGSSAQLLQAEASAPHQHRQEQPGLEVDLPLMTFISQKRSSLPFGQDSQLHETRAPTSYYHTSAGLQQPLQPDSYESRFRASQHTSAGSLPNPFDEIQQTYQQSSLNHLHEPQQEQHVSQASADDALLQSPQPVQQPVVVGPRSDKETITSLPSIQPALSSQPSYDQSIPFDDRLSGPNSPVFDREVIGPYIAGDPARHSSSYSIMELSSELAQAPYFSQARQSPLLQEHQVATSGASSFLKSSNWKPAPVVAEVETGAFDQVSLSEDTAGSAPSVTEVHSPPARERGLASLLDPQTLSAVEDLLNMPKSAAFERGMSRLFKGVKSSATSIFASPLVQPQAKAVGSLDESAVNTNSAAQQETSNPTTTLPRQDMSANASTDASTLFTAHSTSQDGPFSESRKIPEPNTEVLSSIPTMNHWGAPSATSKSPGSAHDLLALIAKSSGEPQQVTYASTPKDAVLVGALEPNHATHEAALLPLTKPENRVPPSVNHAPHLGNRMSEPEHHLPKPEHRMSESTFHVPQPEFHMPQLEQHVPQPEQHVPQPAYHMPESEVHVSQPEFHASKTEYHAPEQGHQVHEPYHLMVERDHRQPEPGRFVPPVAACDSAASAYIPADTHDDTDTQKTQLPSMTLTDTISKVMEDEAHESRTESAHSYSRKTLEQTVGQPLESPVPARQSLSPDFNKNQHYAPVGSPLPRASSPSVLDREVLLKKQAAVSALQATSAGVRARPDKKERLLEKARELLERRQQSAASHHNSSGPRHHQSALPISPLLRSSVPSNYEPRYSSESERRMYPGSSRPSMDSNRASMDFAGSETSGPDTIATASHEVPPPPHSPVASSWIHAGSSNAADALTTHSLQAENAQLKQQIQTMSAQFRMLETNAANAELLKAQDEEMRNQIAQMHASLAEATAAQQQSLWSHTRQLESIQEENKRLQAELEQARHHVQDHTSSMTKCERLETELAQMRLRCQEYETLSVELERLANVRQENERLQQELQDIQQQLRDNRSHLSSSPITISSDGVLYSPEQLSKEAEGLRRQLKGQRDEMKEWQERVKRSETERRDLFAKIEHLERSLADAEKHRSEQKSHQAMKDEAYKVIQERLVASFEEEKAQYLDEEAFKMVKLEHRYNLVKEELEALRAKAAEDDQRQKEDSQRQALELESAKVQALLDEQDSLKGSMTKLQQHVLELESDLNAARKSEMAAQELKKSEELWKASVVAVENQRIALQKELDDCKALLDDRTRSETSAPVDSEKESLEMASLTAALELSRKRERELKHELELASQTIKESALMQRRSSVDKDQSMHHQIELDRLSELAAKQQEKLIAAQEEKMHTEDLLQRAQIELMAARAEISQLEATLQSGSADGSPDMDPRKELEELRSQQKESGDRSEWLQQEQERTSRVSELTLKLEHTVAANQQLQQRLEDAERSLQGSIATSTTMSSDLEVQVRTLMEQLEQERKLSSDRSDQLEMQLERAMNLLSEKQREAEQTSLELASSKHQTAAAERELDQLRLRTCDGERSSASAQVLEQKLEEALENNRKLESALTVLQKEKQALTDHGSMQERLATENTSEIESSMQRVRQLEQDLESANRKRSTEDSRVAGLEADLAMKQEEHKQAQSQLELIVAMFGKLLKPTEDREELAVLDSTVEATLAGLQPLGVPVQSLSRVGASFVALRRLEADNKHKVQDLQAEVARLEQHSRELRDEKRKENNQDHSLKQGDEEDRSEMEALRLKLTRAEQGIGKLQQFLQEFQNEKKAAIFELQQRLDDSDKEVNIARSQLAKAQAMLLSRPSNPGTPTQGSFQSSSLLALPSESSTSLPHQNQNQESQPAFTKASMEYNRALLSDETFRGTELIHHEAVLALEPLRQQKAELERTLQDLRHRYELSQRENDTLLSELERENQKLRARAERMSPDVSKEHLERICELELEQAELSRQLKTANREREFTRQDMRSLKAELAKLRAART